MRLELIWPVGMSVVVMMLSGSLVYMFTRLESGRENAWSAAVVAVALQIVMMSLWVWSGHV
jgi:uncharacterized protein YpmB